MIPLNLKEHKDIFSRIETLFMFGSIPSYGHLLVEIGHTVEELQYVYDEQLSTPTFPSVLAQPITQKDITDEKEKYLKYLSYYLTTYTVERQSTSGDRDTTREQFEYESLFPARSIVECSNNTQSETCSTGLSEVSSNTSSIEECEKVQTLELISAPDISGDDKDQNHLPWHKQDYHKPIPLIQRAKDLTFFIHQKKAIRELFTKIVDDKVRAVLLQAGTGTGKTFIAGGLIEQLWHKDLQFFKDCISPWPCVYITRASIVEQTARVMENKFNLAPVRQCYVMNIEQMRAKFGEYFLREKVKVVKGEETVEWTWIPFMAPRLIVVDESHLAKNERSTQSQIIQAISDLPATIVVFMSATSFMRVMEARYFCVNTHMEL